MSKNNNTSDNSNDLSLAEQIEALKVENMALKARSNLTLKVSDKGCVSIYGLRARFPIALYPREITQIFNARDQIEQFVADNEAVFSAKEAEKVAVREANKAEKAAVKAAAKPTKKNSKTKELTSADPRVVQYQANIRALVDAGATFTEASAMVPFPG